VARLPREAQGGVAVHVFESRIGATFEQQPNNLDLTLGRGGHERGESFKRSLGIDLGASVEQHLNGLEIWAARGIHEAGAAAEVLGVDLGALGQEKADNLAVAVEGGEHHGSPAFGIHRIDGGPCGHEALDIDELADIRRLEEREFLRCRWRLLGGDGCGQAREETCCDQNRFHGNTIQRSRDVYTALAAKWDRQVFSNIAGAEQRHMDLINALLVRYEIEDPVADDTAGAFTNRELSELYAKHVASGETSLENAFRAGATIEDKDIFDLYALIESSENADVKLVANNLVKGSRNHLRAFSKNLSKQGVDAYQAQSLEQSVFDEIASSEWERGVIYDETGAELVAHGGGQGKGQGHGQKGACKNTTGG
jgi:rubrerythrin